MDSRVSPASLFLLVLSPLLLLGLGPDFNGCGTSAEPSVGTPLPTREAECVIDSDCVSDPCERFRCVASQCVAFGPVVDQDGDGFAQAPCGEDCNDRDPAIKPGAPEVCDGVDTDCDGTLDEGSVPNVVEHSLSPRVPVFSVPLSTSVGLVHNADGINLWLGTPEGLEVGTFGAIFGPASELVFVAIGSGPSGVSDRITVLTGSATDLVVQDFTRSRAPERLTPEARLQSTRIGAARAVQMGGSTVVAYDVESVLGVAELALSINGNSPFYSTPVAPRSESRGFATDGTHAVFRSGADLVFVALDGTEPGRVPIGDAPARAFLSSGDGKVFVSEPGRIYSVTSDGTTAELEYRGPVDGLATLAGSGDFLFAHVPTLGQATLFWYAQGTGEIVDAALTTTTVGTSLQAFSTENGFSALIGSQFNNYVHADIRFCE